MIVGRQNSTINKKERENKTKQNKTMSASQMTVQERIAQPITSEEDVSSLITDYNTRVWREATLAGVIWTAIKSLKGELAKYKVESKRWEDMCESITIERDGALDDLDAHIQEIQEIQELETTYKELKAENNDLQKQVEELNKVVLRWQEKADFNLTDSDSSEEEDEELKPEPGKVSQ